MITYVQGDLFSSPASVLVNPVNTMGVMGKGLARRFKTLYPDMYDCYRKMCQQGEFQIGDLWLYEAPDRRVLNFPTKQHWRSPSQVEYVEKGLIRFVSTYEEMLIESIAFPALGCGNGGLDFESQVRPLMEKYLNPLLIEVSVYLYVD